MVCFGSLNVWALPPDKFAFVHHGYSLVITCIYYCRDDTGGWIIADHEVFITAMSVYNKNISQHRMLYMDYLTRHLHDKNRSELVSFKASDHFILIFLYSVHVFKGVK